MKLLSIYLVLVLYSSFYSFGQDYSWKLLNSYVHPNIEAWDINPLEELIVSSKGSLHKLDTNFQVVFTQSKKEFGDISKIDARHSLKTLLFSENQQMLVFVDNTLTFQEGKVDLSSLSVDYATQACYSDHPNRFWIYDEQDARLFRFEGIKSSVKNTEISNLSAITLESFPTSIVESQNQLLLFYKGSGVFIFDYYGSLLRKYDFPKVLQIYPTENHIYLLRKNELMRVHRRTGAELTISLPIKGVEDFRVFGDAVYFKDKTGVKKYSLFQEK